MYGCLSLRVVKGFVCCIMEKDSSGTIRAFQVYLLLCISISPQLGMPGKQLIKLPDQSCKTNRNDCTSWYAPELQRRERDSDGWVTGGGGRSFSHFYNSSRFQCNVITLMMHICRYQIALLI